MACALCDIGEFLFVILFNFYLFTVLASGKTPSGLRWPECSAGTRLERRSQRLLPNVSDLNALVTGILGCGVATLLRIVFTKGPALVFFAALNGVFFAFWAVASIPR